MTEIDALNTSLIAANCADALIEVELNPEYYGTIPTHIRLPLVRLEAATRGSTLRRVK